MKTLHDPKVGIRLRKCGVATIFLAGVLLLAGCAVGPKYHRPPVADLEQNVAAASLRLSEEDYTKLAGVPELIGSR